MMTMDSLKKWLGNWRSGPAEQDIGKVNTALLPLLALAMTGALIVGLNANKVGGVLLWCAACLAAGATLGFLFGIPRSLAPAGKGEDKDGKDSLGRPNTNLEEVSDWLTKILVGLSLVNYEKIEARVDTICRSAAATLADPPAPAQVSMASAIVIGFTIIGFLCGYLYTRLFLQGAFVRSFVNAYGRTVSEAMQGREPEPTPASGEPLQPSPSDRQAAERVRQAAPAGKPDEVLAPVRALAAEYETIRRAMPDFSAERTRRMTEVATRMRAVSLAAQPYLAQLAQSHLPGERLAAVVILQMAFDPAWIDWLAARLNEERAFIGYQAASVLLARVRVVGPAEGQRIHAAVAAAKARITQPEGARDALIENILKEAPAP
ncbi:hypothetical protein [Pelomonas sp. KK5]|uniref:hypothetical protein n=1 Tax=Pelomonas sp. KK5 TaxID=1855730 RepID=UPI00097CB8F9|nr:hypothetical protein [Pelomonas sp. KK5]